MSTKQKPKPAKKRRDCECAKAGYLNHPRCPTCGTRRSRERPPLMVIAFLMDLHKQATEDRSHYYTAALIRDAIHHIKHQCAEFVRYGTHENHCTTIPNGIDGDCDCGFLLKHESALEAAKFNI